jgi:hypothetical protein
LEFKVCQTGRDKRWVVLVGAAGFTDVTSIANKLFSMRSMLRRMRDAGVAPRRSSKARLHNAPAIISGD